MICSDRLSWKTAVCFDCSALNGDESKVAIQTKTLQGQWASSAGCCPMISHISQDWVRFKPGWNCAWSQSSGDNTPKVEGKNRRHLADLRIGLMTSSTAFNSIASLVLGGIVRQQCGMRVVRLILSSRESGVSLPAAARRADFLSGYVRVATCGEHRNSCCFPLLSECRALSMQLCIARPDQDRSLEN